MQKVSKSHKSVQNYSKYHSQIFAGKFRVAFSANRRQGPSGILSKFWLTLLIQGYIKDC